MRVLLSIFTLFAVLISGPAMAQQATVFPPEDCSDTEFRSMSWKTGHGSTRCLTGQEVLALALPNCQEGQKVVKRGDEFVCEDDVLPKLVSRQYKNEFDTPRTGNRDLIMGDHLFCALSGVEGPGGWNTNCHVQYKRGVWVLEAADTTPNHSHACHALCFDYATTTP